MNKRYRKTIIAGNWKMHKLASEIPGFMEELRAEMPEEKSCETVICVPFPLLPAALDAAHGKAVDVGAQDVSENKPGAYTGEVAADMLRDIGVKYCIVGHSERRAYHGETDLQVNAKVSALIENGVRPIVCVGESLSQREKGLTMDYVNYQLRAALSGLTPAEAKKCVIGYEPVWAIGTGRTATAEQAEEVCRELRGTLRKMFGSTVARGTTILYGGSMNAKNCEELLSMTDIDGGLIGGAALNPAEFSKIIAATALE